MATGNEIAKAYVQIVPTANGIQGSIQEAMGGEAEKAGQSVGSRIASSIKAAVIAAGIGKAIGASLMEGADLQQSIGGIETLFKDSADKMKQYAAQAYNTAGISANDYMEQATSFAASLLSSLDGNTKKAAESANQAIIDMADNSNKMGTSLDLIQNAYQGFAKQNYTMLDNLKLGYGGTKEEMQRLLKDAQKLSGVKYDIKNLNDVYSAIHVIQQDLGITGTTAKEAATTFTGSFMSMKAALSNFLGNLALGENIKPSLNALLTTTSTFIFNNFFPMIGNILSQIPFLFTTLMPQLVTQGLNMLTSISQGFSTGFPILLSNILSSIQNIANFVSQNAPAFIDKGFEILSNLLQGILDALPVMISQLPQIITTFANVINDNFPTILFKGGQLLLQFIKGIINTIPTLVANIPKIIQAIVSVILAYNWLNMGKTIITNFGNGIKSMVEFVKTKGGDIAKSVWNSLTQLPQTLWNLAKSMITKFGNSITNTTGTVKGAVKGVFNAVVNGFKSLPSQMVNIGKNLIKGLWNGISDMVGWIGNKIKGFGNSILNGLKDFFGIHSPATLIEDEIGYFIPPGLAVGVEKNMKAIDPAMSNLANYTVDAINGDMNLSGVEMEGQSGNYTALQSIIYILNLILEKLGIDKEIVINLNDREVARALKEMGVVFG